MELTNVAGETMTIHPHDADLPSIQRADNPRVAQCYRRYSTSGRGVLTELQVIYWYVGGEQVVSNFLAEFKRLFDERGLTRLSEENVLAELIARGFDDTTIRNCLGWLVQGK